MDNINSLIRKSSSDVDIKSGPHLNLKDSDVVQIWDEVSNYIDRFMSQSKGVSIPGFGTFSFVQKKIDIGNNKIVLMQRPVFAISEKFAQTHSLQFTKYPVAGNIPVHPLNYAAISVETAFSRDDIESCVRHVLQVFNRSVQSRKNVEFTFNSIGKLQIRNSKVKMKFFKDFVNNFDETGKAVAEMQNRPNTADSVMSRNDALSRLSRNTCLLPRLNSRNGANSSLENLNKDNNLATMDTISEELNEEAFKSSEQQPIEDSKIVNFNETEQTKCLASIASIYSSTDDNNNNLINNTNISMPQTNSLNMMDLNSNQFKIPEYKSNNKQQTGVFINDNPNNPPFNSNEVDALQSVLNEPRRQLQRPMTSHASLRQPQQQQPTPPPPQFQRANTQAALTRPSSRTLIGNLKNNNNSSRPTSSVGSASSAHISCGHANSGQELCYLCHQRNRRNVPVYIHEEVRQKELEEDQLLMQYNTIKDMEKQLRDEEKRNITRSDRAKVDAFNLGMSQAIKEKLAQRPKTSDLSRSFIFRKRVRTPPKMFKQQDLADTLNKQIELKQNITNQTKQEIEYLERMEQLQLAEDLAAQREAYLREKQQRQSNLKNALDTQVKTKPAGLPKVVEDGEVFGLNDAKNEKLAIMKKKELDTFKYHKDLIEQRRREQLLQQLKDQERDYENLERSKEEYRVDRARRFERMMNMRKNLENSWRQADEEKKLRDLNEKNYRLAHDGKLVHEQCDKYKRCSQCQKDVKNCGETNIWSDTGYLPGTRIMA